MEQKIDSNWTKTKGLMKRGEYSTVVVRAATTIELAANLLIRAELEERRKLPGHFVDSLMLWANGIVGKVNRILLPIYKNAPGEDLLKEVQKRSKDINDERNNVAHRGEFKAKKTAERVISESVFIINTFSELAGTEFRIDDHIEDEDEDA